MPASKPICVRMVLVELLGFTKHIQCQDWNCFWVSTGNGFAVLITVLLDDVYPTSSVDGSYVFAPMTSFGRRKNTFW